MINKQKIQIDTSSEKIWMVNKHMKKWVIREKTIKTTTYPLKWVTSKRLIVQDVGRDVEKLELAYIAGENVK